MRFAEFHQRITAFDFRAPRRRSRRRREAGLWRRIMRLARRRRNKLVYPAPISAGSYPTYD